ncbi:MAG TPA: class I SAM-dependent methyltransferase [Eubacteriaceae bacterium]|nr:class I SAM-dependent methyltransferase [Eubacteriaceae bacterium]
MGEKKGNLLFNAIAPIYGLFFNGQKTRYKETVREVKPKFDLTSFKTVLDVGCGTGAFSSVLDDFGLKVTAIDPARKMLKIAASKTKEQPIRFEQENILEGLPYEDNAFDVVISSYVVHGLEKEERKQMYKEMSRVAREYVLIHDYNDKRSFLTSVIEYLEGGDYFHFIKHAKKEMKDCVSQMKTCFTHVEVIEVGVRANWYICRTKQENR